PAVRAAGGGRQARRGGRCSGGCREGDGRGDGGGRMKVLFLFGPNLGALGRRDPDVYGDRTLEEIMKEVTERGRDLAHDVTWRQSDHEGELIGWLLGAAADGQEAIVLNAGALTHYSIALRDAIEASGLPAL